MLFKKKKLKQQSKKRILVRQDYVHGLSKNVKYNNYKKSMKKVYHANSAINKLSSLRIAGK